MTEENIVSKVRESTISALEKVKSDIWVAWDESEIRKPHADEMEDLMKVRSLDGKLVNGYRMFFGLAMIPGGRGILHQEVFSSNEKDFDSQNAIVKSGIMTGIKALQPLGREVTHILDRGHDDAAKLFDILSEDKQHILVRLKHLDRKVYKSTENKGLKEYKLNQCFQYLKKNATLEMKMKVKKGKQTKARKQTVIAEISATRILYPRRLTYKLEKEMKNKFMEVSLVKIELKNTNIKPLYLITDWEITDAEKAKEIAMMYLQRWGIEENFKFLKEIIGYEQIQLLKFEAVKNLMALGCVAAQYLYHKVASMDWPEIKLLAKLGGYVTKKNTKPGIRTITWGLQKIIDKLLADIVLEQYIKENGALPKKIQDMLMGDFQ